MLFKKCVYTYGWVCVALSVLEYGRNHVKRYRFLSKLCS